MSTSWTGGSPSSPAAGTPLPPPPARTKEQVPILNASPLVPFAFPWQVRPPAHTLVVAVKATFTLLPGRDASLAPDQLPPSGDVRFDDAEDGSLRYASDFVVRKPKADILLVGHAYPSDNPSVCAVSLQVGSLQQTIAVFGDRTWGPLGAQSHPAPFQRMPLRWERAMGGPLSDVNPLGRGFKTGVLLPNLERPDALVRSPRDAPAPAGFAPIPPEWKQRMARLGTFGTRWLRERWPFLPEDFDYQFFNAAPAELQVPALRGDETLSLRGVHPHHTTITSKLPGIAPRTFAHMFTDAGGAFVELPLQLDTLWIDADALQLVLVWRGMCSVRDDEASDLATLFVTMTQPGETLTLAQAQARYVAEGLASDLFSTAAAAPALAPQAPPPPPKVVVPAPRPGPSWLPQQAAPAPVSAAPAWLPQQTAPAPRPPARPRVMPPMPPPPPAPVVSRAEVLAALAAHESIAGRDLTGVDLSHCDLSGLHLAGTVLAGANLRNAKLDRADLTEAVLAGAHADDASFTHAVLAGTDLQGAVLSRVSFAHATLEGANLAATHSSRAVFADVKATRCTFAGADLTSARFEQATLDAADFTGAIVDQAVFDAAHLDNARFYDASGQQCRFDRASLVNARMDDCRLGSASFVAVLASESVWERAELSGSSFQRADVRRANFGKAVLKAAMFNSADGTGASFRKAVLQGASLLKANLMQASFEAADLGGADLRGANLYQAETWRANLQGARLDLANLSGTKLAP